VRSHIQPSPASFVAACATVLAAACSGATNSVAPPQPPPPPPPAPPGAELLYYTTLDDAASVSSPAKGSGAGSMLQTTPANDFVAARVGGGLRTDVVNERLGIPQRNGSVRNIDLERGTIEFWYRPSYDHDDDLKYSIVGTGSWGVPPPNGPIHFGKHNLSNDNAIFVIFYRANGVRAELNVEANQYQWSSGQWILLRLTWDFTVPAGVPNIHLYMDGEELPLTGDCSQTCDLTGPQGVPDESPSDFIYVGSRDQTGAIGPAGVYDEFRIWNVAIPPS